MAESHLFYFTSMKRLEEKSMSSFLEKLVSHCPLSTLIGLHPLTLIEAASQFAKTQSAVVHAEKSSQIKDKVALLWPDLTITFSH